MPLNVCCSPAYNAFALLLLTFADLVVCFKKRYDVGMAEITLTSKQRKLLEKYAQPLKPVVLIGGGGMSEALMAAFFTLLGLARILGVVSIDEVKYITIVRQDFWHISVVFSRLQVRLLYFLLFVGIQVFS